MAVSIGLTSYVARHYFMLRYYVGYSVGYFWCKRYIGTGVTLLPFPDGEISAEICASDAEAVPGFDIKSNGTLVVDIPTDEIGNANRYTSLDAGYTWSLVE